VDLNIADLAEQVDYASFPRPFCPGSSGKGSGLQDYLYHLTQASILR